MQPVCLSPEEAVLCGVKGPSLGSVRSGLYAQKVTNPHHVSGSLRAKQEQKQCQPRRATVKN